MTEKLYDLDPYLHTFSATVVDCIAVEDGYEIVLDRTAFFPEGGGQYGDTGTVGFAEIFDTQIRDGVIYHRSSSPIEKGSAVECQIDWDLRFPRMRNHSGEHVVSGIIHREFGYENVGFHMSNDRMTMDYSGELTEQDLLFVESAANKVVAENREIFCDYPPQDVLETLNYRSKKDLTEAVRIVTVDGIDTCACCAPQVGHTGEIGGIFIVDAMRWKGGTRLTVRCGDWATEEYRLLRKDEKALCALFSAPRGEVFPAAEKLARDYADLRRQYNTILKENALMKLESLSYTQGNVCFLSPCSEADVMRAVANGGVEKCSGAFVCLFGNDTEGYRYIIASSVPCLREKAKEINLALKGKGGGSDTMIQGSFSATEMEIREFFKEFAI